MIIEIECKFLIFNLHPGDRASSKSKRIRQRPPPAETVLKNTGPQDSQNYSAPQLHSEEPLKDPVVDVGVGGAEESKTSSKTRRKRGSAKQEPQSTPRITIKLVSKKTKVPSSQQKSGNKRKGIKFKSEVTEDQCAQISSAHVKLKTAVPAVENSAGELKKETCTRRRGRSADKKPECAPQTDPEAADQKPKLRKSTRKPQNLLPGESTETKAEENPALEGAEVNKLVIRRQRRKSSNSAKESVNPSLAESLLEVSTVEESRSPSKKKKKKKKKKKNHKDSERNQESAIALADEKLLLNSGLVGIPGLKLTRIRNPKARSRKKRCKFVWTLTLVKSKSKDTQDNPCKTQESPIKEAEPPSKPVEGENLSTEAESSPSKTSETDTHVQQTLEEPLNTSISENPESLTTFEEVERTSKEENVEDLERFETTTQAHPEESTQTDPDEMTSKDIVPPLQIKVVSSPGKKQSLKQSFLIQQVATSPVVKELSAEVEQNPEKMENVLKIRAVPALKRRNRLRQNTARKKRGKHKHWTIYRRRCKTNQSKDNGASEIAAEVETQVDETLVSPVSPTKVPALLEPKPKMPSHEVEHKRGKRSIPSRSEPQIPEAAEPQTVEQTVESTPTDLSLNVVETQHEIKVEETSTEMEEVLGPTEKDQPQVPRPVRRRIKHVRRKRRALIGRRLKNPRMRPKDLVSEVTEGCPPTVGTDVGEPKPLFLTKFKRKRIKSIGGKRKRVKLISKQLENTIEEQISEQVDKVESVNEKAEDQEVQPSKTKFLKNIRHFIMPVVSARSSRVIKTPKRFMDDVGMSELPRRNSQKKLGLQPRTKRHDSSERGEPESLLSQDEDDEEDDLGESHTDLDLSSTVESTPKPADAENFSVETPSGKRRSLLRDPGFKWGVSEPAVEDVFNFNEDLDKELETLLSAKDFPMDVFLDPLQKKKKPTKFKAQSSRLKIYKKLKLKQGLANRKKTPATETKKVVSSPAKAQKIALEEGASLIQSLKNMKKEKAKLKIEDLNTPGVVRKVSICVRALSSKLLAQHKTRDIQEDELPDEFSIHTDISLPNKCKGGLTSYLHKHLYIGEQNEINSRGRHWCYVLNSVFHFHLCFYISDFEKMHLAESKSLDSEEASENVADAEEKVASHRPRLTGANKRMFNLLKKAKVQLIKIDQQKHLKSSGVNPLNNKS